MALNTGVIEWGEYMRVHVKLDITKPLVQRKKLQLGLLVPVWIGFSYDGLPYFYFCLGSSATSNENVKNSLATSNNLGRRHYHMVVGLEWGNINIIVETTNLRVTIPNRHRAHPTVVCNGHLQKQEVKN